MYALMSERVYQSVRNAWYVEKAAKFRRHLFLVLLVFLCMFFLHSSTQTFNLLYRNRHLQSGRGLSAGSESRGEEESLSLVYLKEGFLLSAKGRSDQNNELLTKPARDNSIAAFAAINVPGIGGDRMKKASDCLKPWYLFRTIAEIMGPDFQQNELVDPNIEKILEENGFNQQDIENALDWIERVALSGSLPEVVSMMHTQRDTPRVADPLELAYLSQTLWKRIEACRLRGILSNALYEKLLEDIRVIDTRDWEDDEVKTFLAELLNSIIPHTMRADFMRILDGSVPEHYC